MNGDGLKLSEVELNTESNATEVKIRTPKRIVHCSDGIYEEYSDEGNFENHKFFRLRIFWNRNQLTPNYTWLFALLENHDSAMPSRKSTWRYFALRGWCSIRTLEYYLLHFSKFRRWAGVARRQLAAADDARGEAGADVLVLVVGLQGDARRRPHAAVHEQLGRVVRRRDWHHTANVWGSHQPT